MLITQKVGFKEWEQQVFRKAEWLNGFSLGERTQVEGAPGDTAPVHL